MAQHPNPEGQAEKRGEHEKTDHPEGEDQVLVNPAAGQATQPDREGQSPEVIADQHDIRHLQRDIGAGGAHGDPDVGCGQSGGVIHAVADHGDEVARVHQSLQFQHLLVGQKASLHGVRSDAVGHRLCDALVVSGQDQDLANSRAFQSSHRGGGIGARLVRHCDHTAGRRAFTVKHDN